MICIQAMNTNDLLNQIRAQMVGKSMRDLAKEWDVSPAYLSDVLRGNRTIGPKLLTALGVRRVETETTFEPIRRRKVS